jgi:predicted component of type VI protein secretion system
VRVAAGGLIGRNPTPGPGETADYLVQIVDPDRSVSKTHLEFAVDGDEFWVRDRASTNGTRILSQGGATDGPDLAPNEWTRVHRGSRVAMGDHHFDLA